MSTAYVQQRYPQRLTKRHCRLLPLSLVVTGALGVLGLAFIVYVLWPRWPAPAAGLDAPALPITVAGTAFIVPPAAIRVPVQRQSGAHERIDLAFLWPSLQPPDPAATAATPSRSARGPNPLERIFITITVARGSPAPQERVTSIYPHYAETSPVAGPDGLAVLPFRQGTPYQGEDLVYDASMPTRFLVRCSRSGAVVTRGICLHVQRIGEADVTVRFPRDWLDDWRAVAAGIDQLIGKLRPAGSS